MSSKAEVLAKLRRLAAPGSGATDGERKAALAAIERITVRPEPPIQHDATELSPEEIEAIMQQINAFTEAASVIAEKFSRFGQSLAEALNPKFYERTHNEGKDSRSHVSGRGSGIIKPQS